MEDNISSELRAVEREVDEDHTKNALMSEPFSRAVWHFLAIYEDYSIRHFIHTPDNEGEYAVLADNLIHHARWCLKWLTSKCPIEVPPAYDDDLYSAALQLSGVALAYGSFTAAFSYATWGLVNLVLDGNRIKSSGPMISNVHFEAYDRLLRNKTDLSVIESVDRSFEQRVKASVRIRGNSFEYPLTPKIVQNGIDALAPAIDSRFLLPADWNFPRFTLEEFRQIARVLFVLAFIHLLSRIAAIELGCEGIGVSRAVLLMGNDELFNRVCRYSRRPGATVSTILEILTYGAGGQSNPDPALQPIIQASRSMALLAGGSVLGGGGRNGFVQSWRITANGLEAIAELHNDLTLFLDELAQIDPREATETAYLLGNGSGKTRMSRNIGVRKKLSWSLLFVSPGEVTLADHAQTAGKRTKGGAEVRLLNIEADAGAGLGLFEDIHGTASPDVFARQLKEAAARYYGTPLRAFLEFVVTNRASVESTLRGFQEDFLKRHVSKDATGEVFRAAQRLALVAAAGELATRIGITGWRAGEATDAAARCLRSWIEVRGTTGSGDMEAAINQVRRFIGVHGASRFQSTKVRHGNHGDITSERIINRAGFRVDGEDGEAVEYLILPEVFRGEVCEGFDYRAVAHALLQRGHLDREPPHLTKKPRLPEVGSTRVYAVKSSILGD